MAFFAGVGTQDPATIEALLNAFIRSWAGTTPDEFDAEVRAWLATVKQPKFGVPYTELVYKPMLELIELLTAHDFRVFVCSGGGRDFMRVFAEETWGDVDIEMLESAAFALVINHDDDEREFAYTTGAEKTVELAADHGWTVVSIKDDWSIVYGSSPAA